jgi:hypothetical protein
MPTANNAAAIIHLYKRRQIEFWECSRLQVAALVAAEMDLRTDEVLDILTRAGLSKPNIMVLDRWRRELRRGMGDVA